MRWSLETGAIRHPLQAVESQMRLITGVSAPGSTPSRGLEVKHLLGLGVLCAVLVGCGGGGAEEASSTTATALPSTTTTVPTAVSAEQLAKAEAVGDVAIGEELFFTGMDGINHDASCSTCHSFDGTGNGRNPDLLGISTVAGERIEGMSDVDYLRQSLTDPTGFKTAGEWSTSMPYEYADLLSEADVNNLVAFLMTR